MAKIIITRPEHDPLTRYLSHWSTKIIESAEKKGNNVIDLRGKKANKKELEGRIKKTEKAFREKIILLLTQINDPNILDDVKDLYWNMSHQVCLGGEEMSL